MSVVISMLIVVHVVVCVLLVLITMMQRPRQEGLGAAFGAGLTDQMFGAQTTNVLQKGTVWLAVMFFVITMVLAILVANQHRADRAFVESLTEGESPPAASATLPVLPKPPEAIGEAPTPGPETGPGPEGAAAETKVMEEEGEPLAPEAKPASPAGEGQESKSAPDAAPDPKAEADKKTEAAPASETTSPPSDPGSPAENGGGQKSAEPAPPAPAPGPAAPAGEDPAR